MAELVFTIVEKGISIVLWIKEALAKVKGNEEDCRRIAETLDAVNTILTSVKGAPMMEDKGIRLAMTHLENVLVSTQKEIDKCLTKNKVLHAAKAGNIAEKLDKAHRDLTQKILVVVFALLTKCFRPADPLPLASGCEDPTDDAGYINKRKSKTKKKDGSDATGNDRSEGKHEKNSVLANSKAPCTPVLNGLTESASGERVTRHGGSSIVNKASNSFVSKSANKMQSTEVSGTPSQLERIISVPKGSGEANSDDIRTLGKLIEVYRQELRFPFEGNKEIQCPVTLTNRTDHHVGVWITQTSPKPIKFNCPNSEIILEPRSTLVVFVTLESKKQKPLQSKGKFQVLMIVLSSKKHLRDLKPLNMDSDFWEKVGNLQCEVHRAMLTAVICDPARDHIIVTRSTESLLPKITSIDVHHIKTWILMSHVGGHISIWNYQTKELITLQVNDEPGLFQSIKHLYDEAFKDTIRHGVYSVKFISRKKWLVAGDGYGIVHVYSYTNNDATVLKSIKRFKACSGNSIDSLAVHPSMPYLLTSSVFHKKIELWNWDKGWSRFQQFDVKTTGVRHLTFNPRDTNTFACITYDRKAMVWNIQSSSPTTTLPGPYKADHLFAYTHQHHFLVNLGLPSHSQPNHIWDLQTKEKVQSLRVSGRSPARRVACHPTLPLLATTLDDGHICLWDANTYRLEKMIHTTDNSSKKDLVFTVSNGLTRLVARSRSTIAAIEVNWPMARTGQRTGGRSS